eukprot:TRINITY_DN19612_c0_g1_i1.p1 TRINITY_DN19612_c0_g1~~TRINITY_DN19612_c0_g1_i1.p1  ORF type:complete len:119 (-),score=9.13 TRINITY_DN19612_c0_g1_i1:125-481(-)
MQVKVVTDTSFKKVEESKSSLEVVFLSGPKKGGKFAFGADQAIIKIGRMNDCNIIFEGSGRVSRYQCSIISLNGDWILEDGLGTIRSKNGTMLYLDDFYPILNGFKIKIGQTLFLARL